MCIIDCLSTIVFILPLHLDYTKVIILILWWRNFQLEYWRTFQLVSTPDPTDFSEDIEDSHNVLKNANYEAGAHIKYLVFEGYKIPVSESELEALKARASEYLDENGVMVGFVNNLLGL